MFHELAQEMADFCLLTNQCGIPPVTALVVNFLSGISVMFGVIVILAIEVPAASTGVLLALSSGVYIFIAAGTSIAKMTMTPNMTEIGRASCRERVFRRV